MANTKQITIRFNVDDADEAAAYEYMQTTGKSIYQTHTKLITTAILRLSNDKYVSPKPVQTEIQSNNIDNVAMATLLKSEIRNMLPELVAATLMQLLKLGENSMPVKSPTQQIEESEPHLDAAAWDFLDNL